MPQPDGAPGRPEISVGAVALLDDELLLIRRATAPGLGLWSLPGGRVEWGETMAEAVVREVSEETGLDVMCGAAIDWVERISDEYHFVIVNFHVSVDSEQEPMAGTDASEVAWVHRDDIAEQHLVTGLAEFLADHRIIDALV